MRSIYRLLATTTLACIAAYCLAATSSKPVPAPDQRGTEQQPLVVRAPTTEAAKATQEHAAERSQGSAESSAARAEDKADRAAERAEDASSKDRDFTLAVVTLILTTVVGAATVAILWVQARAFWKQTEQLKASVAEMQTATSVAKSAADSAKQAADAAVASNSLGRTALIADQRAWIAIRGDSMAKGIEREPNGWRLKLMLMVQNTGKTPAHNVQLFLQIIPALPGAAIVYEDTHAKLRREAVTNALDWHGELFFPGDTARGLEWGVLLADSLLAPWYATGVSAYPILVSGCVYYFADGLTKPRMTSFLVGIEQAGGGHVVLAPHSLIGTTIPAASLRTIRSKTGWSAD
ncbi:MAG TPA: hypothetical protein VK700_02240 [Steroidobacteraceae bacterium]|jgi:hypothetical protein|nr:hypothetical protein [Steroidobacteraceae bacterium]